MANKPTKKAANSKLTLSKLAEMLEKLSKNQEHLTSQFLEMEKAE